MPATLPLPIGNTDYKETCSENYYVDKTLLIKDLLDENLKIVLFTRPRRFGKTLNMDMLRTFFEKTADDNSQYFTNKRIWQQGERYTKHQGKYPVIFITLKDVRARNWSTALDMLKFVIRTEFARHKELLNSQAVSLTDQAIYNKIIMDTARDSEYRFSLQVLCRMLHAHHQVKPIIIVDEYDTPVQEGYMNAYYDDAIDFIRSFFSAALKDNPHLMMSILTGILRIAKESIFSGLNNVRVFSVLDTKFSSYFGFTTDEITAMASYYNKAEKISEIKEWYDGYRFGANEIFNPWSVLNYFSNDCQPIPYWVRTSENAIIKEILKLPTESTYQNLTRLMDGASIKSNVETDIIYPKLKDPQANILGFLLMTGYLKATEITPNLEGIYECNLEIPNKELRSVYRREILALLKEKAGENTVIRLQDALLSKNTEQIKLTIGNFLIKTASFFDGLQENYYHGLILGLVTILENTHKLLSNRESGDGRYDIQLEPKSSELPGIIIELKSTNKASANLSHLATTAYNQILTKKYDTELLARNVHTIYKYGIAFRGKEAEVVSD